MDFAVPAHHRLKLNEGEERDKCQGLARELKIMRVTATLIVIDTLGIH